MLKLRNHEIHLFKRLANSNDGKLLGEFFRRVIEEYTAIEKLGSMDQVEGGKIFKKALFEEFINRLKEFEGGDQQPRNPEDDENEFT